MTLPNPNDLFRMPRPDQWLNVHIRGENAVRTVYVGSVGFDPATEMPEVTRKMLGLIARSLMHLERQVVVGIDSIELVQRDAFNAPQVAYTWLAKSPVVPT